MTEVLPIHYFVGVGLLIFAIGAYGFLTKKNILVSLMCIELMLNAVNLIFVALSQLTGAASGQVAVVFVMVVAACEAAVGLSIVISVFRAFKSNSTEDTVELKG